MIIRKRLLLNILCFSLSPITKISAQTLPDSITKKIDNIFTAWNLPYSPGCAIGIVRNDTLIYAKGYGSANLEYGIPITPATIFHMASVSKQFTAFSIVLLATQGKLKLDDDIRKYLRWFPDLHTKITIRNLLNHTSGIRDQWQLLGISGTRMDDVITQDQIIKILSNQRALNFEPGSKYSYSNSGFTMLAEIVKSVSGQTLRKFTDSAIFKPLGMNDTHFHDDYTEIVMNRSYSYQHEDTHFSNSILSYSNAGATSLFTNVKDMSKWLMNFYIHKVGDQSIIDQLVQKGKLINGKELNYALGISVDMYNGWREYSHNGADAGYRTAVSVFPDLKMGFIVFSNVGDFNPGGKANEIANLFIKDTTGKKANAPVKVDSGKSIAKGKFFAGPFVSEDGVRFDFPLHNQRLYWKHGDDSDLLSTQIKDTFVVAQSPEIKFVFSTSGKDTLVKECWPDNNERVLAKYTTTPLTDEQLQLYAGTYYCPELDYKYNIVVKNQHLVLTNTKYNDSPVTLAGKDDLFTEHWFLYHLRILRNDSQSIIGFEVNSGRIMHLRFNKI
jgi:CubicO group peptidase (beta-lactamase class C family)